MGNRFASGKRAIALCDRCGQKVRLTDLRTQYIKQKPTSLRVCRSCLDVDHPQLMLGTFPVDDPQAVRNPRPDNFDGDARNTAWGWNPVGGGSSLSGTPNPLVASGVVGTVQVVVS